MEPIHSTSDMKKQPIVVVGGGSIGKRHIRNLKQLGYQNIYCLKRVYDEDFEKEMGVQVITDPQELKDLSPLAVIICKGFNPVYRKPLNQRFF